MLLTKERLEMRIQQLQIEYVEAKKAADMIMGKIQECQSILEVMGKPE